VPTADGYALHPEILTWTALLGRWMEFAASAVALPADAEGERWRESVPAIISLQAVTLALNDLPELPVADRPLARDKADLLVRENVRRIEDLWRGAALPGALAEIIEDARAALERSAFRGAVEIVWTGPEILVMPAVPVAGDVGTFAVAAPGTLLMPGEPAAWWIERDGDAIAAALPGTTQQEPGVPRQVYRLLDDAGRMVRDVVAPVLDEPPDGLPLLVPLCEQGLRIGHFPLDAEDWERRQRALMVEERLDVEHRT